MDAECRNTQCFIMDAECRNTQCFIMDAECRNNVLSWMRNVVTMFYDGRGMS